MNAPQLDPVSVATLLLASALGPQLATVVGPYAVIIIASITGAAWSLGRRPPGSRVGAAVYFARLCLTAVLLSVAIESAVQKAWPSVTDSHYLLAPIALLVGGIGDDWPGVGRWFLGVVARIFERRTGGAEG